LTTKANYAKECFLDRIFDKSIVKEDLPGQSQSWASVERNDLPKSFRVQITLEPGHKQFIGFSCSISH
jgi:hypothetical protein